MQMIFSGSVTQGPNSAAFSGTKKRSPPAIRALSMSRVSAAMSPSLSSTALMVVGAPSPQLRFGLDDVEDAALGADAEAVFAALAQRREGHALRQLLRAGARSAGPGRGRRRKAAKARRRRSADKRRGLEEGPAIVLHGFLPSGPDTAPAFRAG